MGRVEGRLGRPRSPSASRIPTGDPQDTPLQQAATGRQGARPAGRNEGRQEASRLASPRPCQPAHARMCGFLPHVPSNPLTLQQIIKTHLYLICLLELIEFLRSANASLCCLPIAGSEQLNDKAADQPQAPQTALGVKRH